MANAILVGLSRQVALGRELDVVANNIANLNTNGFKADGSVFEEYLSSGARTGDMSRSDNRVSFVRDRATWTDLSQGAVERTGNPLDIAISGQAYLVVQTQRGERYTRNGGLQINATGQLVTSDGNPVLGENGPITFQPKDRDITISRDGTVSVREGSASRTEAQRGKIRLVSFDRPQRLQKDGSGTFMAPNGVNAEPAKDAAIEQGAVEKSNVRSVIEMTRMIEVSRAYTQIASLLQTQGDMRRSAIDKLADVPA